MIRQEEVKIQNSRHRVGKEVGGAGTEEGKKQAKEHQKGKELGEMK